MTTHIWGVTLGDPVSQDDTLRLLLELGGAATGRQVSLHAKQRFPKTRLWTYTANRLAQLLRDGRVAKLAHGRTVTWSVTDEGRKYAASRGLIPATTYALPEPRAAKADRMGAYRKEKAEADSPSPP